MVSDLSNIIYSALDYPLDSNLHKYNPEHRLFEFGVFDIPTASARGILEVTCELLKIVHVHACLDGKKVAIIVPELHRNRLSSKLE